MVDTCFLCAVGSLSAIANPAATTKDEFGTCRNCGVHACPRHGEPNPQYFWCSNCITGSAARQVSAPPSSGSGDPSAAMQRQRWLARVDRFGREWFLAATPGTALSGSEVFDAEVVFPMRDGLSRWLNDPRESFLERLELALGEQVMRDPSLAAGALGYSTELIADGLAVEMALARIGWIFDELHSVEQEPGEVSWQRAAYALGVLSAALAGRGSSLESSVLRVRGGLSMPPFVVLLSVLLEVGRGGISLAERESLVLST